MSATLDVETLVPRHSPFTSDENFMPAVADPGVGHRDIFDGLLRQHGGGSLGWMRTWPAFSTWVTKDGRSAVSYCVVGNVAIVLGDPVGPGAGRASAVAEFGRFCHYAGWTLCWFAVTANFVAATPDWRAVEIGEDTVVDLSTLQFVGKAWQDVRTAMNRARREGITMIAGSLVDFPPEVRERVACLSQEWVAGKPLPEMAFTLGTINHALDPEVRTHVAVDASGIVHGVTTWLPVHRAGEVVGWTLDLMRRQAGGFRPVMEYLIAESALQFRREGAAMMSLSVAPLARGSAKPGRRTALDRTLGLLSGLLEPVYGFQSLMEFKAKFRPEFAPVYLAYRRPIDLVGISMAISRAYLPDMHARDAIALLKARRKPGTHPQALADPPLQLAVQPTQRERTKR